MYNIEPDTFFIGKKSIYLPNCHSTNDVATELLAKKEVSEGTIISTSYQTAGKGQRGNRWESEADKNLMCSLIVSPHFLAPQNQFYLNMVVSLAILDLLDNKLPKSLKVKWPNDIYYTDKKLGGILIESVLKGHAIDSAVLGIGLNINQSCFYHLRAISLSNVTRKNYHVEHLLTSLCEHVEHRYLSLRRGKLQELKQEYIRQMYWYQEVHTFTNLKDNKRLYFQGQVLGVNDTGKLAVQIGGSVRYFNFKEIAFTETSERYTC